jgi:membrane protease YdiL (CAAX protease family)
MIDPESYQPQQPEQPPPLDTSQEPAPERRYPFWSWVDVLLLAIVALPLMLFTSLAVLGISRLMPELPRVKAALPIAATFSFYALWFLLLYWLIRSRYGRPFWVSMAWLRPPGGYLSSFGWGLLVALASILFGAILRPPEIKTPLEELMKDPASLLLVGIFAVTLGPLCEELAFRGFFMPLAIRTFGAVAGIVLAAAPFALLHGFEYAWSWQRLLIIFFAGAAFGFMRYRSGSTSAAAVMHAAYNLVFFAGLLAQRAGYVR